MWKAIIYKDGDNMKIYKLNSNERLINKLNRNKKRFFSTKEGTSQIIVTPLKENEEKKPKLNFQLVQNVIFSYKNDKKIEKSKIEIKEDEEITDSEVLSLDQIQFNFDANDTNTESYFGKIDQINLDEFDLFDF